MSDIDYKAKGSILAPLKNLSFFGRPAVTVPLDPRRRLGRLPRLPPQRLGDLRRLQHLPEGL